MAGSRRIIPGNVTVTLNLAILNRASYPAAFSARGENVGLSLAEYTCAPATQLQTVHKTLPWELLGVIPEMLQTA